MNNPTASKILPGELGLTPEEEEDTRAVIEKLMTGEPLDPEIHSRISQRAARTSQEVFERHGLLDVGVPAIRALRDGADE
jgi:hypothetical protein